MNKTELIAHIAEKHQYTKAAATELVGAVFDTITEQMAAGETVSIPGFGTFKRKERPARKGFNPKTRQPIDIEAGQVPLFTASSALKKSMMGQA